MQQVRDVIGRRVHRLAVGLDQPDDEDTQPGTPLRVARAHGRFDFGIEAREAAEAPDHDAVAHPEPDKGGMNSSSASSGPVGSV